MLIVLILYPEILLKSFITSSHVFANSKEHTTTHLLQWLKLTRLTLKSVGKDVKELELSCTTSSNVKCYNYFEKHVGNYGT